jgi:ABC-type nickel/cobalt efflux system permease component RcnA
MTSTELASYVLLLSLPLWLLVEQLIHLRTGDRKGRRSPVGRPAEQVSSPSLSEALRSGQK